METPLTDRLRSEIKAEMARQGITVEGLSVKTSLSKYALGRRLTGAAALEMDEYAEIASALGLHVLTLIERSQVAA